jgi:hypothetical protein
MGGRLAIGNGSLVAAYGPEGALCQPLGWLRTLSERFESGAWGVSLEIRNRSWVQLLAFCLTTTFLAGLALAVLLATATLALAAGQANEPAGESAQEKTFAGVITDSYCGARHSKDSGKTSDECTRVCVRNGAKYTLVSGDKSYALAGNESAVGKVAGQRAQVNGRLEGETLQVASVAASE